MPIDRRLMQNMSYYELVELAERQLQQISAVNSVIFNRENNQCEG